MTVKYRTRLTVLLAYDLAPPAKSAGGAFFLLFFLHRQLFQGLAEDLEINGLGHMGIHPRRRGSSNVLGKRVGRHRNDGHRLCIRPGQGADLPGRLTSVHLRHLHIHQHRVDLERMGIPELK